jgi:outer membrane protein OmpA-like peptidoglycan-associated protein
LKTFILILAALLTFPSFFFAQQPKSALLSDCFGSLELNSTGSYKVSLTGTPGLFDDLYRFSQLTMKEENSVWFRIEFQHGADASIEVNTPNKTELTIFRNVDCEQIMEGKASPVFTTTAINQGIKYKFENHGEGDVFYIVFNTLKTVKELTIEFHQDSAEEPLNTSSAIRLMDRRLDPTMDYLLIMVRDEKTRQPVTGQIVIRELNKLNALYNASDLIFPKDRNLVFNISVDAFGYFPFDRELKIMTKGSDTLLVELMAVEVGKQIELEGIEFFPQSNKLLPASEERLKRLRDFLIFNSEIRIEVQGHVHHVGNNNFSSKRLSKRRANSVKNFLVKNGIDKNRLVAVGYGNTQMRYPNAQSASEERANRRVEVRIID